MAGAEPDGQGDLNAANWFSDLDGREALTSFWLDTLPKSPPAYVCQHRIDKKGACRTMPYTLGEAAKATGKSKPTIHEQIKKGRISASKDDLGRYKIDPAELHRIYPPISSEKPETERSLTSLMKEKEAEIRGLQDRLKAVSELKERIERECEDLREDRNHWRLQARALPAPEALAQETSAPKRGFFQRLLG